MNVSQYKFKYAKRKFSTAGIATLVTMINTVWMMFKKKCEGVLTHTRMDQSQIMYKRVK